MPNPLLHNQKKGILDHCGLFAIIAPRDIAIFPEALGAFQTLQTRGYDGAGFWALSKKGVECSYKAEGMIGEVFSKAELKKYAKIKAQYWLFQNRYGTSGEFSSENVQPIRLTHQATGEAFCLIHNGQFIKRKKDDYKDFSDTWVFASKLAKSMQLNWPDRIGAVLRSMKGAYSIIIVTARSGVFAFRDSLGIRPLSYGTFSKKEPHTWVISSETAAIDELGANNIREIMPGSLVEFRPDQVLVHRSQSRLKKRAHCIFEAVYLMDERTKVHRPSLDSHNIQSHPTVNLTRFRSGQILAMEAPVDGKEIDFVCGIPGTGITGGQGYAN